MLIDWEILEDEARAAIPGAESVDTKRKAKTLRKFGFAETVNATTWTTLSTGPNPNAALLEDNLIDTVSSDDAADAGKILWFEGHTTDPVGHLTFFGRNSDALGVQLDGSDGTTPVALPSGLTARDVTRARARSALAGDVYFYTGGATGVSGGVPTDTSRVQCHVPGDSTGQRLNRTQRCQTAVSDVDVLWLTSLKLGILRQSSVARVTFEVQIRERGSVWETVGTFPLETDGVGFVTVPLYDAPIFCPPSSDVRTQALAVSGSGIVAASRMVGRLGSVRYAA